MRNDGCPSRAVTSLTTLTRAHALFLVFLPWPLLAGCGKRASEARESPPMTSASASAQATDTAASVATTPPTVEAAPVADAATLDAPAVHPAKVAATTTGRIEHERTVPPGDVQIGAAKGGAAILNVATLVPRYRWRFKSCCQKTLAAMPAGEGSSTATVTVDATGEVVSVKAAGDAPATFHACTSAGFREMKFEPTATGASDTFTVTIVCLKRLY